MAETELNTSQPKDRKRSPRYPAFSLKDAVGKVRTLLEAERGAAVPVPVALGHWDLSPTSSTGKRCLATLLAFGLLDEEGTGADKRVRISVSGRILARHPDQSSAEYRKALQEAALRPSIHKRVWDRYKDQGFPSSDTLAWDLETDWAFHPGSVNGFIAEIKETFDFAGVFSSDILPEQENGGGGPEPKIAVGMFVQWTSQGADQLQSPAKVTEINDDGYAFVEGSSTGIPVAELRGVEPPADIDPPPPPSPIRRQPGMNQATYPFDTGVASVQWPAEMSADEYKDFKDWLKIIARKVGRAVGASDASLDLDLDLDSEES